MLKRISLPVQLLLVIIGVSLFGSLLTEWQVSLFYTGSVLFKELLGFFLPIVVFAFVLSGMLSFKKNAPLVLLSMIAMIFCSNSLVAFFAYGAVKALLPIIGGQSSIECFELNECIQPLWAISFPPLVPTSYVLLVATICGIFFSIVRVVRVEDAVKTLKRGVENVLCYTVIPFLPLYVLGFLLKIKYEGMFIILVQQYGGTFALIVSVQIVYLIWLYFVASEFSVTHTIAAIRVAFPSYLTAFSTMSSTAALPVSIKAAEKNTDDYALSAVAMPIMANIHLIGDAIGTPILAMVTMYLFFGHLPTFSQYVLFVVYFCTSMFAASGIPAGGLMVTIPILTTQLGFTPDMISIITTLYLLLDSFGTAANVMGDGALVIIVQKVLKRVGIID